MKTVWIAGGFLGVAVMAAASMHSGAANADQPNVHWIPARGGEVPPGAIIGGAEPGRLLPVCRGWYNGGTHPGKIVGAHCNIGWGGNEILLDQYEVLVGDNRKMRWVDASDGYVPPGAIVGGSEPSNPSLYVCRGYHKGWHPGKIVGSNCNIGYGGRELLINPYQVLVPEP